MIGLLLSFSDLRCSYPLDADGDRSLADRFGSTVWITLRTRTVIDILLAFRIDGLGIPPAADGDRSIAELFRSTVKLSLRTRTLIGRLLRLLNLRCSYLYGRGR